MRKLVFGIVAVFALLAVVPEAKANGFFVTRSVVAPVTVVAPFGNSVFFTPSNVVFTPVFTPFVNVNVVSPFFGFRTFHPFFGVRVFHPVFGGFHGRFIR